MYLFRLLSACLILLFMNFFGFGQTVKDSVVTPTADSSIVVAPVDSSVASDSLKKTDTVKVQKESEIDHIIHYSSKDSLRFDVMNKVIYLFKDSKVVYGDMNLEAERINVNWTTQIMTASGVLDTAGKLSGRPIYHDLQDKMRADTIRYNITTKKGIITNVVTSQGEGYIIANKGKKDPYNNYYFDLAKYSTCNLEHPHFYIGARKLKVIPEDKVVTGPFNIYIADVPTPFGFLFGFFPIPEKRKSGIIFPSDFGQHKTRGFYFTQGGYYLNIKDNLGVAILGDAYANGSWRLSPTASYAKRYKYRGKITFNYGKLRNGFDNVKTNPYKIQYNLRWTHSSQSKGNSHFSASVNAGSSGYYKNFSYNPSSIITGTFTSNITYQKTFGNTPFNMTSTIYQTQNTQTGESNYRLPAISFNMNRIYPFKNKKNPKNTWYQNINVQYNLNTEVDLSNFPTAANKIQGERDTLKITDLKSLISRAQYGASQKVTIGTTIKPKKTFLKYFSVNPGFVYNEYWDPSTYGYTFNEAKNKLDTTVLKGFYRSGSYSFSTSLITWLYGTAHFRRGKLAAIRHSINPTLSYSYNPDFSLPQYGNYFNYTDTLGNKERASYFYIPGFVPPTPGKTNALNFNLQNILEAKVRTKDTAQPTKKIKLIDRFGLSGSYNFAADSFQLSNIAVYANTRLLNLFNISYRSSFDPYYYRFDSSYISNGTNYVVQQTRTKELAFMVPGGGFGRFTNAQITCGANFNPKVLKKKVIPKKTAAENEEMLQYINAHPELYVDFTIPWNLNVTYVVGVRQTGYQSANLSQALTLRGDLKLSQNWKFGFNSGYDLVNKKITVTSLHIYRDLHCWQMAISVNLFSTQQSYMFTIRPKAGILQDLKLNKRSQGAFGQPSVTF